MTGDLPTFVTHLECSMTGRRYEADRIHGLSEVGRPLMVRYDLEALGRAIDKETLARRPGGFWRYREFLPVRRAENVVSLGEVTTPLVRLPRLEPAGG
ncbi:MAG: threonine synthase, partial [Alphaproteobacteria bacterium]|nr:threonine synthase [Alphaproteobacteria bacterium]